MNVYKIDNLENLLQCAICLDRFQTPKVLPCQHTFCLGCLKRIYSNQHRTINCPTCRKEVRLVQGPDELPGNLLLVSLMDVQPVKAKCPCCNKMETLTICEHCHCTKCSNCNEKHLSDIRESTKNALNELEQTDQKELKDSMRDAFRTIRNEISGQFLSIRQQHDAILLTKQIDILQKLDNHEQTLLKHVDSDLQTLEKSKRELTEKDFHLASKTEPELITLLSKASDTRSQLADRLAQHHKYLNSVEISLQYDPTLLEQINTMCNEMQLNLLTTDEAKSNPSMKFIPQFESILITLRTILNQDYQIRISSEKTIYELKELFARREKLDPNRITLTKSVNFFEQLDDNRTLKSYDCDSSTVLMIGIRK